MVSHEWTIITATMTGYFTSIAPTLPPLVPLRSLPPSSLAAPASLAGVASLAAAANLATAASVPAAASLAAAANLATAASVATAGGVATAADAATAASIATAGGAATATGAATAAGVATATTAAARTVPLLAAETARFAPQQEANSPAVRRSIDSILRFGPKVPFFDIPPTRFEKDQPHLRQFTAFRTSSPPASYLCVLSVLVNNE